MTPFTVSPLALHCRKAHGPGPQCQTKLLRRRRRKLSLRTHASPSQTLVRRLKDLLLPMAEAQSHPSHAQNVLPIMFRQRARVRSSREAPCRPFPRHVHRPLCPPSTDTVETFPTARNTSNRSAAIDRVLPVDSSQQQQQQQEKIQR